jgi:hypothetical protein
MQLHQSNDSKIELWNNFVCAHKIENHIVPLFDIDDGRVTVMPYGRDRRFVLKRSGKMESLMRGLGSQLISQHAESHVTHDGILYMMLVRENGKLKPLYIGKAEIFGKADGNLSANISDLATGHGKFGRWGYNYAYHLGDLSAVTCQGHSASKSTIKYTAWRDKLFIFRDGQVIPRKETLFWATLWGPNCQSIWQQYGSTKLAFEEYLVIGVASDVFPNLLLNREGRTR